MLTPIDGHELLDRPAVRRLVEHILAGGANGLFLLGSMGEGPNLRLSVRQALVETTVEAVAGRVPVIAGVLRSSTADVIDEIRALSGRGLDGFVVTTPYYYSEFDDDRLYDHFRRAVEAADLPVLLYSIPSATRVAVSAELVLRLAELPGVAGMKDSSGNWDTVRTILQNRPDPEFTLLQGWTPMAVGSLLAGADGLVPGEANIFPRLLSDLVAAVQRGDLTGAFDCEARVSRYMPVHGWRSIHALKVLGKAMGLMEDYVTSPLPLVTAEETRTVLAAGEAAGLPILRENVGQNS